MPELFSTLEGDVEQKEKATYVLLRAGAVLEDALDDAAAVRVRRELLHLAHKGLHDEVHLQ
jgi:hypothetical protein